MRVATTAATTAILILPRVILACGRVHSLWTAFLPAPQTLFCFEILLTGEMCFYFSHLTTCRIIRDTVNTCSHTNTPHTPSGQVVGPASLLPALTATRRSAMRAQVRAAARADGARCGARRSAARGSGRTGTEAPPVRQAARRCPPEPRGGRPASRAAGGRKVVDVSWLGRGGGQGVRGEEKGR